MSVTTRPNYKMANKERFLLRRGLHFEKLSKPGEALSFRTYSPKNGENVVESNIDLERLFGKDKFSRVDPRYDPSPVGQDRGIPVAQGPNLEGMSEEDLRKFAEEEGIDIKGVKKGDIKSLIKTIRDEL